MFDSVSKKINLLMAKEGISGMQLARKLGIPASTIKKIRSKKITNPTMATLVPIARYFSVTLDYLLEETDNLSDLSKPLIQHHNLRLISWEEASQYPQISTKNNLCVISEHGYGVRSFALLIETLDEPIFPLNSFIIIDSTAIPQHRDFVITTKNKINRAVLKQFLCGEGKSYLRSLNGDNNIEQFTAEYRLIGVVAEYHNQFKRRNKSNINS